MDKALKQLRRAERLGRAEIVGFGLKAQPRSCPVCGAKRTVHGGYFYPIRRHGWWHYQCGRRWHPERGWSTFGEYQCESDRMSFALLSMMDEREVRTLKQARQLAFEAVEYAHLLEYRLKPRGRRRRRKAK
jgi:hypothetical protein